ncbi:MAG: hypothetical protein IK081_06420 [Lachnospiraceae bacterium]|nr:hypothetical protein [Lachnospiraceae bacterium]
MSNNVPKTIGEFKAYVRENNVPLEKIHMHLDEDYHGAKAFGIYRDGDEVIVYKNKADGSRAIHYQGLDEAYAVSELYLKMREMEMAAKDAKEPRNPLPASTSYTTGYKYYQQYNPAYDYEKKKKFNDWLHDVIFIVVLFVVAGLIAHASNNAANKASNKAAENVNTLYRSGYYYYNDAYYYNTGYLWFCYDFGSGKWDYVVDSKVEGIVADYDAYATSISGLQIEPFGSSSSGSNQSESSSNQNDRYSNSSDRDERYSDSYDWDDDDDWSYDWDDDDDWDYDYDNDWDWDSDW